jgi:hypothetical protein
MQPPSLVFRGVFVGTEFDAANLSFLLERGIESLVNCDAPRCNNHYAELFEYLSLSGKDSEHLLVNLPELYDWLLLQLEARRGVLLFCKTGNIAARSQR